MKVPFTKPTAEEEKKLVQDLADKIKKDMEDCDGDYLQYIKKHNRHTLSISLRNEQTGEVDWEDKSVTFYNEDNAISHLALCACLLEQLTQEENMDWGYKHTSKDVIDRIITPIVERLNGSCPI